MSITEPKEVGRELRRTMGRAILVALAVISGVSAARAQEAGISRTLTLKEAVDLAVMNSRDLALARLQYNLAQRQAGLARSAFGPSLYAGSGLAYSKQVPFIAGSGVPAIFTAEYDQQVLNLPAKGDQHVAEQEAEKQRIAVDGMRDTVVVRAALEYLELAKVRHALELMRSERLSAGRILDAMRDRVEAGRELPIEVTRAQLTAAKIEQQIGQLEDRDDFLSGQLRDMMGLPQDSPIEVSTEDIPAAAADQTNDLVSQAMADNVELKQVEIEQRAREVKLKGEIGGRIPTVQAFGQYNVLSKINNYFEYYNTFKRNNVIVGVQIRVPIFWSHTSAAVSLAQADLNLANLTLQKKRSDLSLDVRQKARVVRAAGLADEVARLDLQLAQENLNVLQAQFDQGRGSLKDLEAAHIKESDKWLAYLDANYAHQQAQLELLQTTGQVAKVLQ